MHWYPRGLVDDYQVIILVHNFYWKTRDGRLMPVRGVSQDIAVLKDQISI